MFRRGLSPLGLGRKADTPTRSGSNASTASTETNADMADATPTDRENRKVTQTEKLKVLEEVLDRFEITVAQANELVVLQDYNFIIIADDSASMMKAAEPLEQRKLDGESLPKTRWDELQDSAGDIIDIAAAFDEKGVDMYFLNRQPVFKVRSSKESKFLDSFESMPTGSTPLTEICDRVVSRLSGSLEKKVILFIMTDGEPTGGPAAFIDVVQKAVDTGNILIQIMACTSDEEEIRWLNDLDTLSSAVDVVDDFYTERREVLQAGVVSKFTRGDWCMKAMLAPVCEKFDKWDESRGHTLVAEKMTEYCAKECACSMM